MAEQRCLLDGLRRIECARENAKYFVKDVVFTSVNEIVRNFIAGIASDLISAGFDIVEDINDNVNDLMYKAMSAIDTYQWTMYLMQRELDNYKVTLNNEITSASRCISLLRVIKSNIDIDDKNARINEAYKRLMDVLLGILEDIQNAEGAVGYQDLSILLNKFSFSEEIVREIKRIMTFSVTSRSSQMQGAFLSTATTATEIGQPIKLKAYEDIAKDIAANSLRNAMREYPILSKYANILMATSRLIQEHVAIDVSSNISPITSTLRAIESNAWDIGEAYIDKGEKPTVDIVKLGAASIEYTGKLARKMYFPASGQGIDLFTSQAKSMGSLEKIIRWHESIDGEYHSDALSSHQLKIEKMRDELKVLSERVLTTMFTEEEDAWRPKVPEVTTLKRVHIEALSAGALLHYQNMFGIDLLRDRESAIGFMDAFGEQLSAIEAAETRLNDAYPIYGVTGTTMLSKLVVQVLTLGWLKNSSVDSLIDYYETIIRERRQAIAAINSIPRFRSPGIEKLASVFGELIDQEAEGVRDVLNTGEAIMNAAGYLAAIIDQFRKQVAACRNKDQPPAVAQRVDDEINRVENLIIKRWNETQRSLREKILGKVPDITGKNIDLNFLDLYKVKGNNVDQLPCNIKDIDYD